MFEGLKMAADLIKTGVAEAKLWSKLDDLAIKAKEQYEDIFTARQKELYSEFMAKKAEYDAATGDKEKVQATLTAKEDAELAFLNLLSKNARLPKEFKEELLAALDEIKKSDGNMEAVFERAMMRYAKTDAEKEEVRKELEKMKQEDAKK